MIQECDWWNVNEILRMLSDEHETCFDLLIENIGMLC